MATAGHKLATDTTLEAVADALGASGVLAKNTTLADIADALGSSGLLHTDLGNIHSDLDHVHTDLGTTIHGDLTGTGGINSTLSALAADATLQAIAEILTSVKSVNGKYDVVVLDSGDIYITKNTVGSKTVKQVLTELETAVAATPLTFTAELISRNDYKVVVTQGTPS